MAAVPAGADAAGADAPPPQPQEPMRQQDATHWLEPPQPPWSPSDEVARGVRTAHAEVEKAVARLCQEPCST